MVSCPEVGQLVVVRKRPFVVVEIVPSAETTAIAGKVRPHLLKLSSVEDDGLGDELEIVWELEPGTSIHERSTLPETADLLSPELTKFADSLDQTNTAFRRPRPACPASVAISCSPID